MAVLYELWVETSSSPTALARYVSAQRFTLVSGRTIAWQASVGGYSKEGVSATSVELPQGGGSTVQEVVDLTEAGLRLLHSLKAAPAFTFARVGWEAGLVTTAELSEYIVRETRGVALTLDCVLSDELFEALGMPLRFEVFSPGYRWSPYLGEEYRPIYASDRPELSALCRELFPSAYFKY